MSFWVTQQYYIKLETSHPMQEIYGGCKGFDTYEEAEKYCIEFNEDANHKDRMDADEYCTGPHVNPYYKK